ncbi:MAG: hypothetical protein ACLFSY_05645 [Desulfonatronovibrionaceae bacterium]
MKERYYQIAGLIGFILSGLFFIAAGLKNKDLPTILGSLAWIAACVVWLIPLLRPQRQPEKHDLAGKKPPGMS